MSKDKTLLQNYLELRPNLEKIYVVPEISTKDTENNYLYLLYKHIIDDKEKNIQLINTTIADYPKIFWRKLKGEKNIYHQHWYHLSKFRDLFHFAWRTYWIFMYRLVGGKVVWTVHNIAPHHGKFRCFNWFWRRFLALIATKLHVHCSEAITIMSKKLGVRKKKFFVVEHPDYPIQQGSRNESLKELNQRYANNKIKDSDIIFLAFGLIGKYKKIKETAQIFIDLPPNKKLIIAGKIRQTEENYLEEIKSIIKDKQNIFLVDNAIPDEELPIFFNSADYLILNYDQVLTSGVLYLGLSYNKRIIAIDKGCIKDNQNTNIIKFKDEIQLKEIVSAL